MKGDRIMQNKILQEQSAYYRARAKEYDESLEMDDIDANQELEEIIKHSSFWSFLKNFVHWTEPSHRW
jgi:hypothetical protein